MADRIKLTVSEIERTSNTFIKDSQEILSILNALTTGKNTLLGGWDGDSANAFSNQFDQFSPKVKQFANLIEEVGQNLNRAGLDMQQTDTAIANSFRN
jgi:WXG100 family type VII secretion target